MNSATRLDTTVLDCFQLLILMNCIKWHLSKVFAADFHWGHYFPLTGQLVFFTFRSFHHGQILILSTSQQDLPILKPSDLSPDDNNQYLFDLLFPLKLLVLIHSNFCLPACDHGWTLYSKTQFVSCSLWLNSLEENVILDERLM